MRSRCCLPSRKCFHRYGGRGIQVCKEWRKSPGVFINWALANGWQEGLELDRKENNGNYEPGNCHFITSAANNRNRSTTKLDIETVKSIRERHESGDLKDKTYREIGELFGISLGTAFDVIKRRRWKD
jgi:hypothetical protein